MTKASQAVMRKKNEFVMEQYDVANLTAKFFLNDSQTLHRFVIWLVRLIRFDIETVTEMHEQFLKQGKLPTNN